MPDQNPVSRINKDARNLMGAAGLVNVSKDHETPVFQPFAGPSSHANPVSRPKAVRWTRGEFKDDIGGQRDKGDPMRSTVPDRAMWRFFHEPRWGDWVVKGDWF